MILRVHPYLPLVEDESEAFILLEIEVVVHLRGLLMPR